MNRRTFTQLLGSGAALAAPTPQRAPAQTRDSGLKLAPVRDAMSLDRARFQVDLDRLLGPHDMVWRDKLPGHWYEGAPLGNGDMGALIYGFPENLGIVLSKSDAWDRRNDTRNYFPGKDYNTFRQTYYDGNWDEYLRLQAEAAKARREKTLALPHLTSCGRLMLHLDGGMEAANCLMRIALADGVATLTYSDRVVRALLSREYQVLLVDIDRGEPEVDPPDPILANRYGTRAPFEELPWEFWRPPLEGNPRVRLVSGNPFHIATQQFRAGGEYSVGVAFAGFSGGEVRTLTGRFAGTATGPRARRCQMYVTIVSSGDAGGTVAECRERLKRAMEAGPEKIAGVHQRWWRDYWMRGLASVADRAVEKWYYRSLYLCGSTLEPGRQSPGLQGVWCGENFPRWSADYHSNVNIQCVYWGLTTNNRLDLMEPYLRHYHATADAAREMARDYYRMRGLRFPHMGSPSGRELGPPNMLGTDPCATAWLVQLFWQYYLYSGDVRFLREAAYPLLRDAALFYADFMVRDRGTGKWMANPSVHFEARTASASREPATAQAGVVPTMPRQAALPAVNRFDMWGVNSLYSQAMLRMAFDMAIQASEILGTDEAYRKEWRERVDNMAPPPLAEGGFWKQWDNVPPVYGWHNYWLPLVYPAELVSRFHGPKEWLEQAKATWRHVRSRQERGPVRPGFGGQALCEILRIGEVEAAFEGARWTGNLPENGFMVNYRGALIQVDTGPGMCRVLGDMLVLAPDGVIHLFAGIPNAQPARFHSLRAPGGFLLSGEKRGAEPDYVLVQATAAKRLRLENPWRGSVAVTDLTTSQAVHSTSGELIDVALETGRQYLIAREGFRLEQLPMTGFSFS